MQKVAVLDGRRRGMLPSGTIFAVMVAGIEYAAVSYGNNATC